MEQNHVSKSPCELQELELGQSSGLLKTIPSSLLNKRQKLKKLIVRACQLLEMAFDIDEGDYTNKGLLPQLKELVLTDLPLMKSLRQEPTIPVFKNQVFLELVRCNNLKTLFSISVAKSLGQLELLKLYDCEDMEHVLEGDAGSAREVDFRKLKQLTLKHLRSLISFCKLDCYFKLPELVTVRVKNIPKMETYANGTHQTPKLKFYITYVSNCWQGDLIKTIK